MKAQELRIADVISENRRYFIPPYQRPYSWRREHVRDLLNDIKEAFELGEREYFIGSLITIETDPNAKFDVVDGQQRITTLNLILARLRDHATNEAVRIELTQRILPRDALAGTTDHPRLTVRSKDQIFFKNSILTHTDAPTPKDQRGDLPDSQIRMLENCEEIDRFLEEDDLFRGKGEEAIRSYANYLLRNVYVVFVTTPTAESAYRLFNVLNARGLQLSNADLIKNHFFSRVAGSTIQGDEIEMRWEELEGETGADELDAFFAQVRSIKNPIKARGSLFSDIKKVIDDAPSLSGLLNELLTLSKYYSRIQSDTENIVANDGQTLRCLRALRRVEFDDWVSPLMAFLANPVSDISIGDFTLLLEKITMQAWIRRLGRTARLGAYFNLIKAIDDGSDATAIRSVFLERANNNEFLDLLNGNVYGMPFDQAVLLRLEEALHDESVQLTYTGRITIEHILPQKLSDDYWATRFTVGEHAQCLHRLGNLALLSGKKNSQAQYFDFPRKRKIYMQEGAQVSFQLTRDSLKFSGPDESPLTERSEWTLESFEKRQANLLGLAAKLWSIE
jgi:hypothetical protein